jgi:hypothetical protein
LRKSLDAILGDLKEREKVRERGTWKQELRQQYAPWLDDLVYGFEFKEGWKAILVEAMGGIVRAVGDPQAYPSLRITRLRQELGKLSFQIQGLTDERLDAVDDAIQIASERSLRTCERCGRPGSVRESARGLRYTACDRHAVTD